MPSTWFLGDIHGCAEELAELLEKLSLGSEDRVISLGDLYHRGPDPHGVANLLAGLPNFELILGNHELVMLRRAFMLPQPPDWKVPPVDGGAGGFTGSELAGDGRTPILNVDPERSTDLLRILERGTFWLRGQIQAGPFETQPWLAVHAGVIPGQPPEHTQPLDLTHVRRLGRGKRAPFWYEVHHGPEMVIFGHTPSPMPRRQEHRGRLVAHGLDTGCVYGGALTAWRIEDDNYEVVPAKRRWVDEMER